MSELATILLLLSVPGLPLLLAIPALRHYLPWSIYIALLPATVLLFVPGNLAIELPWILRGSAGLGIDTVSRWWLALSVVTWAAAGTLLRIPDGRAAGNRLTTLFLLTQAGQLGAILATDMVGFFAFTTLMGYAFCGLLLVEADAQARRAGRIYLVLLILADIVLFEALLIAAKLTDDLGFAAVAQAMTLSMSSTLYLSIAVFGFALKAGFWPLHSWLAAAYGSARPAVAFLMWLVPVATGVLGALRWLPLGEITALIPGMLLQAMGAAAVLYAVLFGLLRAQWKQLPAYVAIIATGIFVMGLGTGLVDPAVWNQYSDLVPVFVASVGFGLTIVKLRLVRGEGRRMHPADVAVPVAVGDSAPWYERWPESLVRWGRHTGLNSLPGLRVALLAELGRLRQAYAWQSVLDASERTLQRWIVAITLFVLLGAVVVFVGTAS